MKTPALELRWRIRDCPRPRRTDHTPAHVSTGKAVLWTKSGRHFGAAPRRQHDPHRSTLRLVV